MMSGAQALWNATTGTWLDRTADLRVALGEGGVDPNCAKDCLPEQGNVTPGVWMKALVGTQSRDDENRSSPPPGLLGSSYDYDNSFDQNFWGFLIGADGGKEWTTDSGHNAAWLVGLMGGYVGSSLDFSESNTDVDYEAFSIGVYTTFLHGGFFIDGTLKADLGTMDYDSSLGGGFSDDFSSDFTSVGGIVDMGYRFGMGSTAFFEPLASLSYVKTSIDDGEVLGTDVTFDDGESLQGRLGARLGASFGDSMKSELFIEASAWNEFMGEYDAHLASNGFDIDTDADTSGLYGEVAAGANVFGADGKWNGFLTGAVQFGEDFVGYSGNAGLRYNW
jgi:outer membrane autotransporter protein